MDANAFKYIAIAAMTISMLGAALAIGMIFSSLSSASSRNPSAEKKLFVYAIVGAALAEVMGLSGIGLAFLMLFQ